MALSTKLLSSFWSDDDVGRLDPHQKLAIVWVLTNKDMTNIGYLKVQERQFRFDTDLDVNILQGALKGLKRSFCFEDRSGGLGVLSLNFIKYQWGEGVFESKSLMIGNLVGLARALSEAMREALVERYKGLDRALSMSGSEARGIEGAYKVLEGPSTVQNSTVKNSSSEGGSGGAEENSKSQISNLKSEAEKTGKNSAEKMAAAGTAVPRGTMVHGPGGNGAVGMAEEVLRFLNEKTGQLFPATPAIIREIGLRLGDVGNDVAGVRRMIEAKVAAWSGDPKMAQYLRPDTLFRAEKFPIYWGQREMAFSPGNVEERKKGLRERIERSPANTRSVFHSKEAPVQERENLKKWRAELAELERQG